MWKKNKISDFELMHSYPDFPKDVLGIFADLIKEYDLKPKVDGIYSVDLENKFCKINLNMDRYDLQVLLSKKNDEITFGVYRVALNLCPENSTLQNFPKTEYGDKNATRKLISFYADVIRNCLSTVLNGDFSWYDRIKEADSYESKLIAVVHRLEFKNPIQQKFWKGDKTWRQDIEKYIKDNNITLDG
jgi:hypothetical protein